MLGLLVVALYVGFCRFCFVLSLVLSLLSWCTALCASVSSVLSCVWCLVSLVGAVQIVLVSVLYCCVPVCVFLLYCVGVWGLEFLGQVGRVRFPGEVSELAPYGGAPYLRWAHSVELTLYPHYGRECARPCTLNLKNLPDAGGTVIKEAILSRRGPFIALGSG